MGEGAAGPADKAAAHRLRMARRAIQSVGCNVSRIGRGAVGALRTLRGVAATVARIAARGGDRAMIHGVANKARGGVGVAIAALDRSRRNMGRGR